MHKKLAGKGMWRAWAPLGVCVALLAICTAPAHAISLITNGTFDAPGTSAGGFSTTCTSPAPTCAALPGWTINYLANNGQIDCIVPGSAVGGLTPTHICTPGNPPSTRIFNGSYLFTLYQAPGFSPDGGNYFLADGGTPFSSSIQQSISGLTVGQVYKLTFWQAAGMENCVFDDGPPGCDPPGGVNLTQDWQVTFGSTVLTSTVMSTPIHTSFAWNQQIMYFTAATTTQVLKFFAQGTPDSGPPIVMLDGVTLEAAPEAGTSALMVIGLAGVAGVRRWRRRRAPDPPQPSA